MLKESMARFLSIPVGRFGDEVMLNDLVPSSIALVELVIRLQEECRIRLVQEDLAGVRTVGDLLRVVEERIAARR